MLTYSLNYNKVSLSEGGEIMKKRLREHRHDILPDVSLVVSAISLLLAIVALVVRLKTG